MLYKVGDKVRIKTWDMMEEQYGLDTGNSIDIPCGFTYKMERCLVDSRVVTIAKRTEENFYKIVEFDYSWTEDMFEGIAEKPPIEREVCIIARELKIKNRCNIRCHLDKEICVENCSAFFIENGYSKCRALQGTQIIGLLVDAD